MVSPSQLVLRSMSFFPISFIHTPSASSDSDESSSVISSQSTCSSLASSQTSSPDSQSSCSSPTITAPAPDAPSTPATPAPKKADTPVTRANEHLAVLLPKHHWKPDSQAPKCDRFLCRKKFSIWERKHVSLKTQSSLAPNSSYL
ncbi:hypothetical protein NLI96_g11055 [Meripilus lineatus]|uniref:Uncharacterized protein n=1 Tax=Meripilus lineatus TaxID=2056292 RepID=A0AAD5USG6_9APHY|nr:hypothetical protein NLI96_g11055 [Physisporinus lineatus]